MTNDELYEKAMSAITELYSDTSVSQADAKRNLESLVDEIRILIDTIPDDE